MNKPAPKWLQYIFIFIAAAAVGEALSYYPGFAGVTVGVLAVIIFRQLERGV